MKKKYSNPCSRCGTERVILRTWEEKIGASVVISTEMICPNRDCQKKVDKDNKADSDKRAAMKLRSEQRLHRRSTRPRSKK
jgi:hypothetical protein